MSSLGKPLLKIASLEMSSLENYHWKTITENGIIQNSTAEKRPSQTALLP